MKKFDHLDANFQPPARLRLKTYSHLTANKRQPSEYELVTTQMLYYPAKGGFEVKTPIAEWYEHYQKKSLIQLKNPEKFVDPRETTYADYVRLQKNKETTLDECFRFIQETDYDKTLSKAWIMELGQFIPPLRYVWHGFQMIAAYIGSMAPEGKMTVAFSLQVMDEMRRIQRIAYRMRMLQYHHAKFGHGSLKEWQEAACWQPLRCVLEHLLVTYDWLESFVALNFCVKALMDHLILMHFKHRAKTCDPELTNLLHSFWEDVIWQQQFSLNLLDLIIEEDTQHLATLSQWVTHWLNAMIPAIQALHPFFPKAFDAMMAQLFDDIKLPLLARGIQIER